MNETFQKDKSLQAILYILKRLGGKCDIHKCHKILYFSDNEHLSTWGRTITGDRYIKMSFGAVPSKIYDLFKAVRGDGYFSDYVSDIRDEKFKFINDKDFVALSEPDMDYLSKSDIEVLDKYMNLLKDKSFAEISQMSHGYAWAHTVDNGVISVKDRLTELGDNDDYIEYVEDMIALQNACL